MPSGVRYYGSDAAFGKILIDFPVDFGKSPFGIRSAFKGGASDRSVFHDKVAYAY